MGVVLKHIEVEHRSVAVGQFADKLVQVVRRNPLYIRACTFLIYLVSSLFLLYKQHFLPVSQERKCLVGYHLFHPRLEGTLTSVFEGWYRRENLHETVL